MRKKMLIAITGIAILTSTAAEAQGHSRTDPTRSPDFVCSGNRARDLDARIEGAQRDRRIDPRQAARLHQQVDRYEGSARQACGRRDFRQITEIAGRYDGIERRLDATVGRYRR
jgi:hypothetical protein